ncbi:unnamed protein product [Mycena citricolor]|uniref:Uncharacterized protein n=1 Tax=Mycena citricolor TaxID=2018698 RepID=A0AAD2Q2M2_9AGAR|nr:unnamed protein product [Mycena citricolor]
MRSKSTRDERPERIEKKFKVRPTYVVFDFPNLKGHGNLISTEFPGLMLVEPQHIIAANRERKEKRLVVP